MIRLFADENTSLRFVCRQVELTVVNPNTPFTRACEEGDVLSVPVKHTTGRYYAPEEALDELEADGQVLLRYAEGQNPNGSARDIAGPASKSMSPGYTRSSPTGSMFRSGASSR